MQMVTKENFQEYEEMVYRMEIRAAERNKGVTAATIAYCMTAPFSLYFIILNPTPLIPLTMRGLYYIIVKPIVWPNDYSTQYILLYALLFPILTVIVIFLMVHFVAALIVKMNYPRVCPAPLLNGGNLANAKILCERCEATSKRLDFKLNDRKNRKKVSAICVGVCCILFDFMAMRLDEILLIACSAVLGGIIFYHFYSFLLWLTGLFYRPDKNSELQKLLDCYADSCEKQERKRIQAEDERRCAEEKRRRMEEAEQNRKRGDEIYRQAVATDEVDEHLMQQAADLGSRPACLYLGRQMYEAFASDAYTKAEKKSIAEKAIRYFRTASLEEDSAEARTEAKFGYLSFQCMTESGDYDKWSDMLSQLREIQKSGQLPERYQEPFATLISLVVEMVDQTAPRTSRQNARSHRNDEEPVVKRCYCKFSNAGICSKKSGSYYTAHCDHASNPGQCSIALGNDGLGFEFE